MLKENISDALSGVDPDLIDEAAGIRTDHKPAEQQAPAQQTPQIQAQQQMMQDVPAQKKKPPKSIVIALASSAAVIAAAVAAVVFVPKMINANKPAAYDPEETQTQFVQTTVAPAETSTTSFPAVTEEPETTVPAAPSIREMPGNALISDVVNESDKSDGILRLRIDLKNNTTDEATLRDHINITEAGSFRLEKVSDSAFMLISDRPVQTTGLVRLTAFDDDGNVCDSWAFETEQEFAIEKVFPGEDETYINTDTGIEITFTEPVANSGYESFFSVEPKVDGSFETRGNTLYFIPSANLKERTVYTVTIKRGLPSASGKIFEEDFYYRFMTRGKEYYEKNIYTQSSSSGFSETFVPGDKAVIDIELSYKIRQDRKKIETHLYRFGSADEYRAAIKLRAENERFDGGCTDTSGLREIFTSSEIPFRREELQNYSMNDYILLPDDLEEGYYIAEMNLQGEEQKIQYLMEVSPVSVYAMSLGEENMFFVNSTKTGKAAAGATVTLEIAGRKYTGTVGSDGIAKVETKGEKGRAVLEINDSGSRYIDCLMLSDALEDQYEDLYYTYIYTDRTYYRTSDTIYVWGAVIPRKTDTRPPDGLSLKFGEIETKNITLASDGTFTAAFTYSNVGEVWGGIALMCGDDELAHAYMSVRDFIKPTYTYSIEAPDYALFPWEEPVPVTLKASYFEGTPAEGISFVESVYSYNGSPETYTTGSDGSVNAYAVGINDSGTWRPGVGYMSFLVTGVENSYESLYAYVDTFCRDVMLEYDYNENSKDLVIKTYDMDLSRAGEYLEYSRTHSGTGEDGYDILRGAACDTEVTVTIKHSWTEKSIDHTYYDYIEKKNVNVYKYEHKETQVAKNRFNTGTKGYKLRDLPIVATYGYYTVTIEYRDKGGRETVEYLTLHSKQYEGDPRSSTFYWPTQYSKCFTLYQQKEKEISTGSYYYDYFSWYGSAVYFTEDEKLRFNVYCSDPDTAIDGTLMLAIYQNDFLSCDILPVKDDTLVGIDATRELIPNAMCGGAYFDGRHVYKLSSCSLYYRYEERNITLEAGSDKDKYDAGDTVKISVKAADKDGNPLRNATVHLSLVDEAALVDSDDYVSILSYIYRYNYYWRAREYVSYIPHLDGEFDDGAKGGGGDYAEPRKDFRDTAYFASAVTDADGNAVFEVKMPDSLTTWRATMLALYDDGTRRIYAGSLRMPVVTTRSLFVTPIMQSEFTEGDDVTVSANCAGKLSGGIGVTISGNGINETKTIAPKESANFGKLKKGSYTVTFRASGSEGSDAVELPLTVTDTLLEAKIVKGTEVSAINDIDPTKYPVSISFFDKEYMFCTDILYRLLNYSGESLDMKIAASCAAMELGYMESSELMTKYIGETANGFARPLPSASPDNEITALMCAAAPGTVNRKAVRDAFRADLNDSPSIKSVCVDYAGLAALGEPVLNEIKALYDSGKVENTESGIWLSAAFALCGDYRSAYDVYMKFVPEISTEDTGDGRIKAWIDDALGQKLTAAALITASVIDLPEAEYFARYLASDSTKYDNYALQLVVYIRNFVPAVKGNAEVTYVLDGNAQTIKLNRHHPTSIVMNEKQLKGAGFAVTSGSVYALVRYTGKITEQDSAPSLGITKELSGDMRVGGTVTVTIHTQPYSLVYDVVPCCGKFAESTEGWCVASGQLVTIYTDSKGDASYTFGINVSGDYIVESAVVCDNNEGKWGMCDRSAIKTG